MRPMLAAFDAAVAAQGVTIYAPGEVPPSPQRPYVVRYASTPTPTDYSHAATRGASRWRVSTLYVGDSDAAVFWVAEKVEAALLDQRLTIADKNCSPLKRESGAPVREDDDAEGAFVSTDVWVFTTTNA